MTTIDEELATEEGKKRLSKIFKIYNLKTLGITVEQKLAELKKERESIKYRLRTLWASIAAICVAAVLITVIGLGTA